MTTPAGVFTLYALRHPEVADLFDNYDDCPLTPEGREQAREVAGKLRALVPAGVRPMVLHQPKAQRTIEEAQIIAAAFDVPYLPAGWLTHGPLDVEQLSRTTEYAAAGIVVACGGVPALRKLLKLHGIGPMEEFKLPHGIVLQFEVNLEDHTIKFIKIVP